METLKDANRQEVKDAVQRYYDNVIKNESINNYIPPSGKVVGQEELLNLVDAALDLWLTSGRFNEEFEKRLASFFGLNHALTVNSGSSANLLAISALTSPKLGYKALKKGDEVITVAAGFPTTINPIIQNGLVPVFCDVELDTLNIDITQIEESISPKTKAIFIAHTLGNVFNLDRVKQLCDKHDLWLIEDNCDAFGSKFSGKYTGTFGHIATLSFYPAHHITTGEGGAVLTNDVRLYRILMSFRDWGRDCWCPPGTNNSCKNRFEWQLGNLPYGYDHKYIYSNIGYNLKMTDFQAACGLAQLDKVESFIQKRKENFDYLHNGLKQFEKYFILPSWDENAEPCFFGFALTLRNNAPFDKNKIVTFLESCKVGTRAVFAGNILRQPAYTDKEIPIRIRNTYMLKSNMLGGDAYSLLPNTDIVMNNTFWVGCWHGLNHDHLAYIIDVFETFIKENT